MFKKQAKIGELIKKMSARDYALYLISLSMQSTEILKQKLARKGYEHGGINEVIQSLTELGYINDEQLAQMYFENLKKYKKCGYFGVKRKLIEKKFNSKLIEKLLKSYLEKEETEIAKNFLEAKKNKTPEQQIRMLQNRGFRGDVIMKVVKLKDF